MEHRTREARRLALARRRLRTWCFRQARRGGGGRFGEGRAGRGHRAGGGPFCGRGDRCEASGPLSPLSRTPIEPRPTHEPPAMASLLAKDAYLQSLARKICARPSPEPQKRKSGKALPWAATGKVSEGAAPTP